MKYTQYLSYCTMFKFNVAENGNTPNIKTGPKTYLVPKNCLNKDYDVILSLQ